MMIVAQLLVYLSLLAADPAKPVTSVDKTARQALADMPGRTAFVFTELTPDGPQPIYGIDENERFAVGSSFKLFILGALADEANAGRRRLGDTMLLRRELEGPPHSEMADWPDGSPVTLHTLALKMISISDNTATDHLHYLLGREQIEGQMDAMGQSDPTANRPLLSTREMALLRDKSQGLPGEKYRSLDEADRRAFLSQYAVGLPDYEQMDFDTAAYELAEWYATPMDMARALAWLQRHTAGDRPAHALRAILAIDPKLKVDPAEWPYVGFKGGSEDQLLAGNWLLRHRDGRWYTFHVFCNSPDQPVSPQELIKAVEVIFQSVEAQLAQAPTGR